MRRFREREDFEACVDTGGWVIDCRARVMVHIIYVLYNQIFRVIQGERATNKQACRRKNAKDLFPQTRLHSSVSSFQDSSARRK
jgi:hypothetical protein